MWRKRMELERITMIERQPRAFLSGVIEKINDEWVFLKMKQMMRIR